MNWLNLQTNIIRRPEYVGCDPVQRATWLNLMIYCAEQENGGTIPECSDWKDRRWQQTCGVTKDEIDQRCELWKFDGESLVIFGYPKEKEEEVQRNRESGSRGGKARSEAKIAAVKANGAMGGRPKTKAETKAEPKHKPKRNLSENLTERKGKEEERKGTLPPTPQGEVSESGEDFYGENMPTGNVDHMLELEKRVRSLRSGWELPLAYHEQKLLAAASRCLSELTATQWQTIKDYMHANIPKGVPAWQPRIRTKFLENPADVWTHASAWKLKAEAKRPPSNTIPMPVTPRPTISREELSEIFGDPIKTKKM